MRFAARFEGPPGVANGGVLAGTLAGDGPAEVVIRRPVPVETDLELDGNELRDADGEVLARVVGGEDDLERRAALAEELTTIARSAPRVDFDAAAATRSPLVERHPFPRCFAFGPQREDGLGLLAGPLHGRDGLWAVGWVPEETDPPFVWAALDCPSSAPVVPASGEPPHVLGRIAGRILTPVAAGEPHVVVAWSLGDEGRRKHAASAVLGPDGAPCAVAHATWAALR